MAIIKTKKPQDILLLEKFAPHGGVSFQNIDCVRTGTGFEACINIYNFPGEVGEGWLNDVCGINNTITSIDIHTADAGVINTNVKKAMKEQKSRFQLANKIEDQIDAEKRLNELQDLYVEVSQMGESIKYIQIRLYVSAPTKELLQRRVEKVIAALKVNDYSAAVMLNEQKWEWSALFTSYKTQQEQPNHRLGQPLISNAVAGGNPFHFSSLDDPTGMYLGMTPSGGTVNFSQFTRSTARTSSCGILLASQGGGKSTLLKKLETQCAIAGGFVRSIDPMDEHYGIADAYGGEVINMDGTSGIINMFEIYKTGETQAICWQKHLKKLRTEFLCLKSDATSAQAIYFETLIRDFYVSYGVLPADPDDYNKTVIAGLPSSKYPTCSDFIAYMSTRLSRVKAEEDVAHAAITTDEAKTLNVILKTFGNLRQNYGTIIDGHTSLPDILNIPMVCFHTKNLHQMAPEIIDLLTLNILYLCWDNCVSRGLEQRRRWEAKELAYEDVSPFLITWDEFHRVLSARKLVTLSLIQEMLREMRHYFAGILLVSQSVRDFDPADNAQTASLIRGIFELCQYKWIGRQEAGTSEILRKLLGGNMTESEYERITRLEQGQFIMGVAPGNNLEIDVYASDEELKIFKGGA